MAASHNYWLTFAHVTSAYVCLKEGLYERPLASK